MEISHEALDHVPPQEAEDMVMNVELREFVVFAVGWHGNLREQLVELGGEKLWLEIPSQSTDDVSGNLLGVEMTYDGVLRELKALESLGVGDVVWQVPLGEKVISARWVTNELSNDAAARFRSTLGRLSWLAVTHVGLVYYVSMLARGQATPKEKHERALRMVLRYLKGVSGYRRMIGAQDDFELRCYVDASWGSERSTDRKSISGGAVFLGDVVLKAWARLQQAVALSSAEAELYGLVEGAKEACFTTCSVPHFWMGETPRSDAFLRQRSIPCQKSC